MTYRDSIRQERDWRSAGQVLLFALVMLGYPPGGLAGPGFLIAAALGLYAAFVPLRLHQSIDFSAALVRITTMAPHAAVGLGLTSLAVAVQSTGLAPLQWTGNLALIGFLLVVAVKLLLVVVSLFRWLSKRRIRDTENPAACWLADATAALRASLP